jgi:hypothetical protein
MSGTNALSLPSPIVANPLAAVTQANQAAETAWRIRGSQDLAAGQRIAFSGRSVRH